jgi:2-phosphosulfolactate phosphatase
MQITHATNDTCGDATGAVIAIDVLRAFTTAAFAFAAGARDILLVSTVDEALALREHFPGSFVMGEVEGLPVAGFDFSNSPGDLLGRDFGGARFIQRTSAGTQGVVCSRRADLLLASSFVCAGATVRYLLRHTQASITYVITGIYPPTRDGDEDLACAEYQALLLRGAAPNPALFLQRVRDSVPGRVFADPARPEYPAIDLEYATDLDRFDFAMVVERRDGLLVMRAEQA